MKVKDLLAIQAIAENRKTPSDINDDNLEVKALAPIVNNDFEASSEETVFFIEIDRQAGDQDLDMIKQ